MRGLRITLAFAMVVGLAGAVCADVIHLKNGNRLEVEAWKDAGDVIEFAMGGGVIRIAKAEIQKIEGKPIRGDFRMYRLMWLRRMDPEIARAHQLFPAHA